MFQHMMFFVLCCGFVLSTSCANPYNNIDTIEGIEASNGQWQLIVTYSRLRQEYFVIVVDKNNRRFELEFPAFVSRRPFFCEYWKGSYTIGSYGEKSFYSTGKQKQHLIVSHEIYNFPDENTLVNFLQSPFYGARERNLLTETGVFICVYTKSSPLYYSVGVNIYQLRVKDRQPSERLLHPYVHGNFKWLGSTNEELFFQW